MHQPVAPRAGLHRPRPRCLWHLAAASLLLALHAAAAARIEDLSGPEAPADTGNALNASALIWQPLRASFRPLNRPAGPAAAGGSGAAGEFSTAQPELDDEDQPTRIPLNRFRPTRAPSVDSPAQPVLVPLGSPASGSSEQGGGAARHPKPALNGSAAAAPGEPVSVRLSQDCFECICEATTNCNPNSRCQTSDVRHTRCGLFLISYDQWLSSGLSRQLVSREALARDPAADERAFYECVTDKDCAQRLLAIFANRKSVDCDKDGRIDCYDVAALHQAGPEQCASESFLESQYWSDFNACFGFARR